jgi:methyl-accepting chemotaxis protein
MSMTELKAKLPRNPFRIVNRQVTYTYMSLLIVTVLAVSIATGFILYAGIHTAQVELAKYAPQYPGLSESLARQGRDSVIRILTAVVLNVVIISLIAIVEVKKIVGPLYRMERAFSRVARGELPDDFVARKKDMPRSLIRSFRAMLYALRQEAQKDIDNAHDRAGALARLTEKVEADTAGKDEILNHLRETCAMMEETAARKAAGLGGHGAQENLVL